MYSNNTIRGERLKMKVFYEDSLQIISQLYETLHNDTFCIISTKKEDNQDSLWIYRTKIHEMVESFAEWGNDLVLNVFNKKDGKNWLVNVGPWVGPETNRLQLLPDRSLNISPSISVFVGIATVPNRCNDPEFLLRLHHLLFSQNYPIAKLFITIPKTYKRFNETISTERIKEIESIDNRIEIILVEEDLGPALKYLGPMLHKKDQIQNHALCIVDDDQFYSNYLIGHFMEVLQSHENADYIFPDEDYWSHRTHEYVRNKNTIAYISERNLHRPAGYQGFMIVMNSSNMGMSSYVLDVLKNIPESFHDDESLIVGYQQVQNAKSIAIGHKGNIFYHTRDHDDAGSIGRASGHLRVGIQEAIFRYNESLNIPLAPRY